MTARGLRTPDVGRIYDAFLGDKDNYAEDRRAARRLIAAIPGIAAGARANREFPGRAVRFLAGEAGIRQFLDIGAGLPAMGNSHAAAREAAADARVTYAGIDPVVICHVQGLPGKNPGVRALLGGLRNPEGILDHPDLRAHLDLRRPAVILLVAVLHFVPDEEAFPAVGYLKDAMAPRSCLVISHGTSGSLGRDAVAEIRQVYGAATAPAGRRTEEGIARFFDGLEMVPPGQCDVAAWRARLGPGQPGRVLFLGFLGGIGSKAVMLTLMPAACPGRAGAGARDAVPAWLIARSRDAGPGSRGAGSPDLVRPRRA